MVWLRYNRNQPGLLVSPEVEISLIRLMKEPTHEINEENADPSAQD